MRVAIIGAGYFSAFHVEAWAGIEGVAELALCDRDGARAGAGGANGVFDGNRLNDHASDNPRRTMGEWGQSVAHQQWVFLLLVNVVLFLLGIFIEPLPAMMLTVPLFLPMAKIFGVDLVHLGVVMTANLAIALYTPPVGGTLFVAARLAGAGIGEISRQLIPMMAATFLVVILITYIPALPMTLVWLLR